MQGGVHLADHPRPLPPMRVRNRPLMFIKRGTAPRKDWCLQANAVNFTRRCARRVAIGHRQNHFSDQRRF
jgi:hypothetical protein